MRLVVILLVLSPTVLAGLSRLDLAARRKEKDAEIRLEQDVSQISTGLFAQRDFSTEEVTENAVLGAPLVECNAKSMRLTFRTEREFKGRVFAKGESRNPNCIKHFSVPKERNLNHTFEISLGECGMEKTPSLDPPGTNFSMMVVVGFHPFLITEYDTGFDLRCCYEPPDKSRVIQLLNVSSIFTSALSPVVTDVEAECMYSIHKDGPGGPPLRFAQIGTLAFHVWECNIDHSQYGMLVHSCTVTDPLHDENIPILDDGGCVVDPYLLRNVGYSPRKSLVIAESQVYKYADISEIAFQCQISFCHKFSGECENFMPPKCGVDRMLTLERNEDGIGNGASLDGTPSSIELQEVATGALPTEVGFEDEGGSSLEKREQPDISSADEDDRVIEFKQFVYRDVHSKPSTQPYQHRKRQKPVWSRIPTLEPYYSRGKKESLLQSPAKPSLAVSSPGVIVFDSVSDITEAERELEETMRRKRERPNFIPLEGFTDRALRSQHNDVCIDFRILASMALTTLLSFMFSTIVAATVFAKAASRLCAGRGIKGDDKKSLIKHDKTTGTESGKKAGLTTWNGAPQKPRHPSQLRSVIAPTAFEAYGENSELWQPTPVYKNSRLSQEETTGINSPYTNMSIV